MRISKFVHTYLAPRPPHFCPARQRDCDFCHDATGCVRRSTIDDIVVLETIYVAQYQARVTYQILVQARDTHPDNPALAAAVHALLKCLRAIDEALEDERPAKQREVHIGLGHVGAKQP